MYGLKRKSIAFILMLATATAFFMFTPERASACSCVANPDVAEALHNSDAVFEGTITAKQGSTKLFSTSSADPVTWTFQVNEVWKGKVAPAISVKSAFSSSSCGYEFEEGRRYLVYASDNGKSSLEVSLCSRTTDYGSAGADLAALGSGSTPPPALPEANNSSLLFFGFALLAALATFAAVVAYRFKRSRNR